MDTTLDLGTDVAAFLIYHPDDLAHRADAPLGWYGYDFAYLAESRAGRLVAIGTGADGGYRIRLTTGSLTPAEAAAERARISSPTSSGTSARSSATPTACRATTGCSTRTTTRRSGSSWRTGRTA